MKRPTHNSYSVYWNAGFYCKSFNSLDDAKLFSTEVNGIVMENIWHNDKTIDVPLLKN